MKHLRWLLIIVAPILAIIGCGGSGASSNDQGVSVTLLGLFQTATPASTAGGGAAGGATNFLTGCGQLPQPLSVGFISLGQTMPQPTPTDSSSSSTTTSGLSIDPSGAVYAIVGLQNNLSGQVFRADRVLLEYYIPGASVQPPSTNVALNMLAGPAEAATQGGIGNNTGANAGTNTGANTGANTGGLRRPFVTSLPPSFNQICNRVFSQVPIIPAPIREWLVFNSNQLPEAPFDLEVVVTLTGLSSGGNRYDTNQGLFTISVVPEIPIIPPTPEVSASDESSGVVVGGGATSTLSVQKGGVDDGQAQGLDELEAAFDTESVVQGE
jgi:hypothetical protein